MDTSKYVGLPQPNPKDLAALFSSPSALTIVSLQMAKFCGAVERALRSIPIIGENPILPVKLLHTPYQISLMSNLTKRFYSPIHLMTDCSNVSWDYIETIITRRLAAIADHLKFAILPIKEMHDESCSILHLNRLANQLQQLAENVANLQEANEEFKSKHHQEDLLAEIGDMKGYLELLYQQLKQEEQSKPQKEDNTILRPDKFCIANGQTWDMSARQQSDGIGEKFSNFYNMGTPVNSPESKVNNPPAVIETTMNEFQLKISYLYQEACVAWLRPPKKGDVIVFTFHESTFLKRFKIGTGHFEYPVNILSDATVEILPATSFSDIDDMSVTEDGFLIAGRFDHSGLAEGTIDWQSLGPIKCLRVQTYSDNPHWVVMSELAFETAEPLESIKTWEIEENFESW